MNFETLKWDGLTIHVMQNKSFNQQLKKEQSMKKYRKKPVVISAVIWDGKNFDEVMSFINENHGNKYAYENAEEDALISGIITIKTLEGVMSASIGDYIIEGVNGEYYPYKPDIFAKTYEEVTDV